MWFLNNMSTTFSDNLKEYMTQPTIIEVAASVHTEVEEVVADYTTKDKKDNKDDKSQLHIWGN